MKNNHIHIVSFDIPYPPNYGGVIDVYYCIEALAKAGIAITLHCSYKGALTRYPQLEKLCREVYYYPRKTGILAQLSLRPYGIRSRIEPILLERLAQDEDPILFEGLVSCLYLSHPSLANRKKIFRECNIEHDYYHGLARASHSWWKTIFYHIEANRLKWYEPVIQHASSIAAVAHQDEQYFQRHYPNIPTAYIPSFHGQHDMQSMSGIGKYILYHGNLQLAENENAAMYILKKIIPSLPDIQFIFAGKQPSPKLQAMASALTNVTLIDTPDMPQMEQLIRDAHIHLLPTFQGTGLKLKLLNVLYNGRWVVVNPQMVHGTDVASLCHIGKSTEELIDWCRQLSSIPFSDEEIQKRQRVLDDIYSDATNVQKLLQLLA